MEEQTKERMKKSLSSPPFPSQTMTTKQGKKEKKEKRKKESRKKEK